MISSTEGEKAALVHGYGEEAEGEDQSAPPISVVVADDYPLFNEGLQRRVEVDGRLKLVSVVTDGPTAVHACATLHPQVALVGYHLPGMRGVALIQELHRCSAETQVAVLDGVVQPESVHESVMLGARGYLVKQETGPFIVDALVRIGRGATAFSPAAAACLVEAVRSRCATSDAVPSPRESQILHLLADGATSRQVGSRLFVSEATVKTHLRRLYAKLGVGDRAAAVGEAMRRGWLA